MMTYRKLLTCCLILNAGLVLVVQCQPRPKVCTYRNGCYIGTYMDGYQVDEFEAFLGIPYAEKPRRFEPSVMYRSNITHDASKAQLDCMQKNYLIPKKPISGSEDCLYLNVYRPKYKKREYLPVMVYIFGGGFFSGTSNPLLAGPEYIMDHGDVILVTFNYRVGAFGFLTTGDDEIPGNLGLKDQVLAIDWVYENIVPFGGDNFRIILFGQSAGAVSAHMHMLSEISVNFYGIIALSGTANVPFAIDDNPENTARQTARYCNIPNWDIMSTEQLATALKKVEAYTLIDAGDHLKYWDVDNMVNYRPVVEKPDPRAFLSKHPVDIMREGSYSPVPIMFGSVPNEGGVRVVAIMESPELMDEFNNDFYNLMVQFLEFPSKFNSSQIFTKMDLIMREYFDGVLQLNDYTRQGFMDLVTHRGFYHPLFNAVKTYVNTIDTNRFPVYMYHFDYVGPYTFATLYAGHQPLHDYGVVHCDDLIYLYRSSILFPDFDKNSVQADAVKKFVDIFAYFAHLRKPNIYEPYENCDRTTFNSIEGKICDYIEFANHDDDSMIIRIDNKFDTRRMKFWDDILEQY